MFETEKPLGGAIKGRNCDAATLGATKLRGEAPHMHVHSFQYMHPRLVRISIQPNILRQATEDFLQVAWWLVLENPRVINLDVDQTTKQADSECDPPVIQTLGRGPVFARSDRIRMNQSS